jgi:hypothetical protein
VEKVTQSGQDSIKTYTHKSGIGKLNRQWEKYSDTSIADIKRLCREPLHFWGYVENKDDPDNQTAYFKNFEVTDDQSKLDGLYKGFLKMNEETLANLGKPRESIPQTIY